MTRYLERIKGVWDAIASAEGAEMVGFCLDTCHAHAGGNALETVVADVLAITGRIDLVHCNDSRDDFDSGADRHANLGQGKVDPDLLAAVVRDAGAPVVLRDARRRRRAPRRHRVAAGARLRAGGFETGLRPSSTTGTCSPTTGTRSSTTGHAWYEDRISMRNSGDVRRCRLPHFAQAGTRTAQGSVRVPSAWACGGGCLAAPHR